MVSIKDVAKHAGLSVATVSRVLNNKGYVSEDSRKKIERAISELNYKPNAVARSLFKKQSKTLGLMLPDIMNPFFPELARAVEDVAIKLGYTVILCNSDENRDKEQSYLDMMMQKYVDGLIVASNTLSAEQIEMLNIPVVSLDREISKGLPTIVVENRKGARLAANFLKEIGRNRIAHIRGPHGIFTADERCKGYLEVISHEPWFKESFIIDGDFAMQTSIEATVKLLQLHPEIDGIFAANDTSAIGTIKAVHMLGKKVPEDIAIVGFDGIMMSVATTPELTTIVQPIYELGEKAATLLVQLIEKQPIKETFYTLDVHLVERQST
ncbi:LacI family DNA-binding transcriptional regulator [Bacillus sp. DTU_2020_1000418_1_SI_GHA_SEK_038]|uniref:LacI family DNA-binding transcriptional regulator n=1 Tax=Bacillus sp. DTU_2020_1000418_1_SI_GHA_SEK_038 TaxID=3077585 RepID=UPI0028EBA453|nr:LacI family DNA-binding transcriptional regulator [Bacillus sp. DTU_2020_1000418_1_SI_GHA_SEK_038]WNS73634.1 LacI family DNA-binding transcriptional regulator [Bacillus sp. DTU_2020_1000418_1_SI_GHA_SEK_038]